MDIAVTARHTEITDRFREHLEEKLGKVPQLHPRVSRVDVVVRHEKTVRNCEAVEITCHEHHWTMAGILNALCASGLTLSEISEDVPTANHYWSGEGWPSDERTLLDWRRNAHAGLPLWLTIDAVKEGRSA